MVRELASLRGDTSTEAARQALRNGLGFMATKPNTHVISSGSGTAR